MLGAGFGGLVAEDLAEPGRELHSELATPRVTFRRETITSIDPENRRAITDDGTGACWIELGRAEVGRIEVDFFSTPGQPTGTFTEPTLQTAAEKVAFGVERHARWFGLDRR